MKIIFITWFILLSIFFTITLLQPKTMELEYGIQKLVLDKNTYIINTYMTSHEICSYWKTAIVINNKEEIILEFPHTEALYIKWCAIDIEYITKEIIWFPVCFAGWWGSGECMLATMDYNIQTKWWKLNEVKYYFAWESEYPLQLKLRILIDNIFNSSLIEEEANKNLYFDRGFYKFIDYFNKNYTLVNYSEVHKKYFEQFEIQKSYYQDDKQSYKLFNSIVQKIRYSDMQILKNTILSFSNYVENYGWIKSAFNQKIFELSNKWSLLESEKEELAKYFFLIRVDVHDLKLMEYDEALWVDAQVKDYIDRNLWEEYF
jgi:hypothetical protein